MLGFMFLIFLGFGVFYIVNNKIHIDFKSFFKKGFKKLDNDFGLYCYTGKQGKGKTYSAIKFITDMKLKNLDNLIIITNVKSFNAFSDTVYLSDINEIIEYCIEFIKKRENLEELKDKKLIVFFDEIFTILEKKTAINKKILSFLSQLRKRGIILVTTAQEWSEINITFRRYVRYQISCNMFPFPFFKTALIFNSINDGDLIRWDNDLQDYIAPRVSANFAKAILSIVLSYDTYETISTNK